MKRYVRTQDNKIIDLNSAEYIVNGKDLILHKKYETVGGLPSKPETNIQLSVAVVTKHNEYVFVGTIIKEADTIEELCDKYVVEFNFDKDRLLLHRDFDTLHEACKFLNENFRRFNLVSIKSAIWTDKGLIYVAKVNNEGKLELL